MALGTAGARSHPATLAGIPLVTNRTLPGFRCSQKFKSKRRYQLQLFNHAAGAPCSPVSPCTHHGHRHQNLQGFPVPPWGTDGPCHCLPCPVPIYPGTIPSPQAVPQVPPSPAVGFQQGPGAPLHKVKGSWWLCHRLNRLLIGFQRK